jgi:hypothetical protein
MLFSSIQCWNRFALRCVLACSIAFAVGCASTPTGILKFEASPFGDQMGLHGCWISIPLSPPEVLENAKRGGNPNPEANGEWIKMAADFRDGDQLRLVNCSGVKGIGDTVYYALIRDNAIVLKFHSMILD